MSPPPAPRGRSRTAGVELVPSVLDAAVRLLERDGPESLSIRRIASEAGVSPMSIYNHFDGKAGVVDALYTEGFQAMTSRLRSIAQADPAVRFREGLRCYREFALDRPAVYAVMFQKLVPDFEPSDAAVEAAAETFGQLVATVRAAMDADILAPGAPEAAAQLVWGSCHGMVSLELLGTGFVEDRAANYDAFLDVLFAGLTQVGPTT